MISIYDAHFFRHMEYFTMNKVAKIIYFFEKK
jgi:hypothetical protein